MEKIVVSYYDGGEYEGCDVVRCLEYESCEKLFVDLCEARKVYLEKLNSYNEAWEIYYKKYEEYKKLSPKTKHKIPFDEVRPSIICPDSSKSFRNVDLPLDQNIEDGYLTIQTLEEWFQENREN